MIKHVVSFSGGKDSLATLLLALENCRTGSVSVIFCDTGNEHQITYDYLTYIEEVCGITIVRLKADFSREIAAKRIFIANDQRTGRDKSGRKLRWSNKAKRRALAVLYPTGNPFLDLCLWKGRFPSRKAQFCTEELKRNMAVEFQLTLTDAGHSVVSWQGVRRNESFNRRNAKKIERVGPRLRIFRPIVDRTADEVLAFAALRGIKPNPLYLEGMSRVGCMPCINVNKAELLEISKRFPTELERISEWERLVSDASKHGYSTMMAGTHDAQDRREVFRDLNIWTRVEWSKTTRGGKQFDLLANDDLPGCSSSYGLCDAT